MYVFCCPNSCNSQKYYKLRKESAKFYNGIPISTPPTTPTKRKASTIDDEDMKHEDIKHEDIKHETPTKRAKKSVKKPIKKSIKKEESVEAESSSDYSKFSG